MTDLHEMAEEARRADEQSLTVQGYGGEMSEEQYGLIVSFPDQSQSFVLGFEAGMIWKRLESGEAEFSETVHADNRDVIERMVEAMGLSVRMIDTHVEGWIIANIHRQTRPKLNLVNGGLQVERTRAYTP